MKVFHSYPEWALSGVCSWSCDLIRHGGKEWEQVVLLTAPNASLSSVPADLPRESLNLPVGSSRQRQWDELSSFLTRNAPCIYLPNFDFDRACAVGLLPPGVAVCAVLHSDEGFYYENAGRLAASLDHVVAVSQKIERETIRRLPSLRGRVSHIPHGVEIRAPRPPGNSGQPLRLLYANRLTQYQKRIFDLPIILRRARERGVDCHLTVAGDGSDGEELARRFQEEGVASHVTMMGRVCREEARTMMDETDIFLLPSAFEGLPLSLLEAMSAGAVPVVSAIESGIEEVIQDGENGLLARVGRTEDFSEAIVQLDGDRSRLAEISRNAVQTVRDHFSLPTMIFSYEALFQELGKRASNQICRRRDGKVRPTPQMSPGYRIAQRLRRLWHPTNV